MANSSNNALAMGGILVLVALIAVEFMGIGGDDEATVESADAVTSPAPAPSAQDAGQAAMDAVEQASDTTTEYASDLIVDMDNAVDSAAADVQAMADDMMRETETAYDDITASIETEMSQAAETIQTEAAEQTAMIEENAAAAQQALTDPAIEQHLAAAENAFNNLKMMTPPGDNAYEHYQAVLAIDPNNAAAQAGIQKMVDKYVGLAQNAVASGNPSKARVFVQRAETLSPGSPKLTNLRNMLQ